MGLGFVPWNKAVKELKTIQCWTDVLTEFYMNFYLLFISYALAVHVKNLPSQYNLLALALTSGWYVFVAIESFAAVNGAHINPCITVLFSLTERVSVLKGLFYIPSQLAGGAAGVWFLKQCIPDNQTVYIAPLELNPDITPLQGVGIEWVITMALMTCALGVLDDRLRELNMPGLPVGTGIALGILAAGPYTGGCMNPNIAFAPAAVTNNWKNHWVYWVGPMLGTISAIIIYYPLSWAQTVTKKKQKEEEFGLKALPQMTLNVARGLVQDADKANDVPTKNGRVLLESDDEGNEHKGFFIKQKPSGIESSTDEMEPEPVQKGFYKKPVHLNHRF